MLALAFLAAIVTGHDPDIWFLIGVLLSIGLLGVAFARRSLEWGLVALILGVTALGLLVT